MATARKRPTAITPSDPLPAPAAQGFATDDETFDVDYDAHQSEQAARGLLDPEERAREKRTAIIVALGAEGTIEFDRPMKLPFLLHFAEHGSATRACAYSGVSAGLLAYWKRSDDEFASAYARAKQIFADTVEEEAVHRALVGVRKAVWYQGEIVGYEYEKSDRLLSQLLQAKKPDEYARQVSVSGKVDHQHQHNVIVNQITDEMKELKGMDLLNAMRDRLIDKKLGRTEEEHREARQITMLPEGKAVASEEGEE